MPCSDWATYGRVSFGTSGTGALRTGTLVYEGAGVDGSGVPVYGGRDVPVYEGRCG